MTIPQPNMWDAPEKSVKRKSLENESRLAQEIGFELTPASGNQPWPGGKGDGSHPLFMFELKETKHARITIAERDLAKLCREAATVGKDPAIVLSAYGLPDPIPKDWVVVSADSFRSLLERAAQIWQRQNRNGRSFQKWIRSSSQAE